MKPINLGTCCTDCFDAVNFSLAELAPERVAPVQASMHALSALCDAERIHSLHTGDAQGFTYSACLQCGSMLGGERYTLTGLQATTSGEA